MGAQIRLLTLSTDTDDLEIMLRDRSIYKILTDKKETIKVIISQLYSHKMFKNLDYRYKKRERVNGFNFQINQDNYQKVCLDDFDMLKVIGRGTFGKVMLVRKKSDNKIYAMKVLIKKDLIQKHQTEHTRAEREILESLHHPFLMDLRYAFQTKHKLYFVIDFYKGGELFYHQIRKKKFWGREVKFIVAEITMALGYLHKNGVIYRDLKPENVLLNEEGHICLTDFGMSKLFRDGKTRRAKSVCGTAEYLAPEIIKRQSYNRSVDWWTLGVMTFEMLAGKGPFKGKDQTDLQKKI